MDLRGPGRGAAFAVAAQPVLTATYHDHVAVVRVLRSRDYRWRVEIHDDGRRALIHLGMLVLADASMDEIGSRLAADGVDPDELVED